MATGDLNNNVRKLQGMLKKVNYEKDADIKGVTQGQSMAFFPIYHYLFVNYSQPFSQKIMEMNIELYGKTDIRFIECMYKILRDMFHYKPPITKDQFFSNGFIEKKVIMCTDILRLVFTKHNSLVPKQVKPFKVPVQFAYSSSQGSKSRSANSSIDSNHSMDSKTKGITAAKKPQVVNELRNPKNKYTSCKFNTSAPNISANTAPRTMPSPIQKTTKEKSHSSPIIKGTDEAHGYHVQCETIIDESQDPIDIIANTPGANPQQGQARFSVAPVSDSIVKAITDQVTASLESRLNIFETAVTEQLARFQSRLNNVETTVAQQGQSITQMASFTPSQFENLLARLTILENKVAIMDAQPKAATDLSVPSPQTAGHVGTKTGLTQGVFEDYPSPIPHLSPSVKDPASILSPISVMARDNMHGPIMSPDMTLLRLEEDLGTRSSTPEEKTKPDSSLLSVHFVDTPTCHQAKRIFEMIRDTECLIKDENDPPQEQ